ncbi:1-phosphofructokinase [uncultured Acetatifactor sp.]|uniref:1-phosphofructokinase n=1 Tax=uncultured Acetatifactor sp. TaxID=1671927 RepID=UPI0026230651|nr:1-phosphofructokinase [uncultured Acetatifactor sp.]
MVYTVTFNPSLDYIVSVEDFRLGLTNRTDSEVILPGGKGLNVSIVLSNLGIENTALGFVAGFTGEEIVRRVEGMGVKSDFIRLREGISRINLKLKSIDGTEINGRGPRIGREAVGELMGRLDALGEGDVLVLAGSIPGSMPDETYGKIMERLAGRGVMTVVDATKNLLMNVLEYGPFLVKPNSHELGEIFGVELRDREEAIPYARRLRELGAVNVLVSMAGQGAVLAAGDGEVYAAAAPRGKLVNGVGAGDSMVAGFLAGWMERHEYGHAFRMGIAAGSASAFSELLATREEVTDLYRQTAGSRMGGFEDRKTYTA